MKEYTLCGKPGCGGCPSVIVSNKGITIGEDENLCQLKHKEFQILKELIIEGKV